MNSDSMKPWKDYKGDIIADLLKLLSNDVRYNVQFRFNISQDGKVVLSRGNRSRQMIQPVPMITLKVPPQLQIHTPMGSAIRFVHVRFFKEKDDLSKLLTSQRRTVVEYDENMRRDDVNVQEFDVGADDIMLIILVSKVHVDYIMSKYEELVRSCSSLLRTKDNLFRITICFQMESEDDVHVDDLKRRNLLIQETYLDESDTSRWWNNRFSHDTDITHFRICFQFGVSTGHTHGTPESSNHIGIAIDMGTDELVKLHRLEPAEELEMSEDSKMIITNPHGTGYHGVLKYNTKKDDMEMFMKRLRDQLVRVESLFDIVKPWVIFINANLSGDVTDKGFKKLCRPIGKWLEEFSDCLLDTGSEFTGDYSIVLCLDERHNSEHVDDLRELLKKRFVELDVKAIESK